MSKVITSINNLDFTAADLTSMDKPGKIIMVRPTHFSIDYVINKHMEGNVGKADKALAMQQWEAVKSAFEDTGMEVHVIEGGEGLPDMVFCANQSLPFKNDDGDKEVIMSIMDSVHRKPEVSLIEKWYEDQEYQIHHLNYKKISRFEGMGDAIWHYGKKLLWGGYGFRTSLEAYHYISDTYKVPVIALKLEHPEFYHLDTCFCVLNETSVMIYPGAFEKKGLDLIRAFFDTIIEVPEDEAIGSFACNATCPDGSTVVIHPGAQKTNAQLKHEGFKVVEVPTGEFMKSGGSVFCMKMMAY
ncbi:MAG: hypothetical protein LAT67_08315 [Balneolales bacterium]|nr:hypothetical protein [Balneolales bacterium]